MEKDYLGKIFEPIIAKGGDYQQNFSDYLFHKHNVDRMKVNKAVFADSVTGADSQVEVDKFEKTNPEFIKYANEVYKYTRNLMEFCVDSGLTTQAQYHINLQLYPHYVPNLQSR